LISPRITLVFMKIDFFFDNLKIVLLNSAKFGEKQNDFRFFPKPFRLD